VVVSRLTGPRGVEPVRKPRPLVGRESSVAQLERVVAELRAGRGQVLLLVGEPGIGKTRLLAELRALGADDVTWLEGHCLSYGGLPSWPLVEALRRWLGVETGDVEVVVRTRARAKLTPLLGADTGDLLPALARLLGIRLAPDTSPRSPTGEDAEDELRRGYLAWVEALTEHRPVVLAIEDLHWAHASTRELAEQLLTVTDHSPLLLVGTLRRDPASEGWRFRTRALADFSHRSTEVQVEPLEDAAADQLLATLLPGAVGDETREQLVARAEGNPLYIEELLRALLEGGGLERKHRTWTTTVKPSLLLPPALENLLVARIDRLPEGPRRLAEIAAAIGREFPVAVLERVVGGRARDDLNGLLRAEIVREQRRYPEFQCAFKHGLLQEAALSTLTSARRREVYGLVATAFEEAYASSIDNHLERLAHYHAQAENNSRAIEYLERAAARASDLDAPARAVDLRDRARRIAEGA
jgi:predicted ATPase